MSRPKPPSHHPEVLGEPVALGAASSSETTQTGGARVVHSACGSLDFPCGFFLPCLQPFLFFGGPLGFPCVANLTPACSCCFLTPSSHSCCFFCFCMNSVSIFRNLFSSNSSLDSNFFRYFLRWLRLIAAPSLPRSASALPCEDTGSSASPDA